MVLRVAVLVLEADLALVVVLAEDSEAAALEVVEPLADGNLKFLSNCKQLYPMNII